MCEPVLEKPGLNVFLDHPMDIEMVRVFRAPRDLIWRMWTDSVQLSNWWAPSADSESVRGFVPKVGSRFEVLERSSEGAQHARVGEVLDLAEHSRLILGFASVDSNEAMDHDPRDGMELTQIVQFANHAEGARVTVVLRFPDRESRDARWTSDIESIWSERFDRLERQLDVALFRAVA